MAINFFITYSQPDDTHLLIEFVIYVAKLLDKLLPITLLAYISYPLSNENRYPHLV